MKPGEIFSGKGPQTTKQCSLENKITVFTDQATSMGRSA